jgi:hypothetical protein
MRKLAIKTAATVVHALALAGASVAGHPID